MGSSCSKFCPPFPKSAIAALCALKRSQQLQDHDLTGFAPTSVATAEPRSVFGDPKGIEIAATPLAGLNAL
jgi:hypothetical protein